MARFPTLQRIPTSTLEAIGVNREMRDRISKFKGSKVTTAEYWRKVLQDLKPLAAWMYMHNMHFKFFSIATLWGACFAMIIGVHPHHWDYLWLMLGLSLFAFASYFLGAIFAPYQQLGILWLTTLEMASNDVVKFLVLFVAFLINYGLAMYITFPKSGTSDEELEAILPQFSTFLTAFQSMIELAMTGSPLRLNLDSDLLQDALNREAKFMSFICFVLFYGTYTIMSLILLLNLLIAMMGDRFAALQDDALLKHRVNYARRVLRLELQCRMLEKPIKIGGCMFWRPWDLHAGDNIDGDYIYQFRNVQANKEGGGTSGSEALFSSVLDDTVTHDGDESGNKKEGGIELKSAIAKLAPRDEDPALKRRGSLVESRSTGKFDTSDKFDTGGKSGHFDTSQLDLDNAMVDLKAAERDEGLKFNEARPPSRGK